MTQSIRSQQVAAFLTEMLAGVRPSVALGRDTVLLREIVEMAAARVDSELSEQPDVELEIRTLIGVVFEEVGEHAKAEPMFREAVAIARTLHGDEHPLGGMCSLFLGVALRYQDKLSEAEAMLRESLVTWQKLPDSYDELTACCMQNLAWVLYSQGELAEAEAMMRAAFAMPNKLPVGLLGGDGITFNLETEARITTPPWPAPKKAVGPEHAEAARWLANVAGSLRCEGKPAEAEAMYREALPMMEKLLGPEHPDTLKAMYGHGCVYADSRRHSAAQFLFSRTLGTQIRVLGAGHSDTVETAKSLAALYDAWGKPEEARKCRAWLAQATEPNAVATDGAFAIPGENLMIPDELRACAANLEKIHAAIARYRRERSRFPDWLSDLVPEYVSPQMLLCPNDPARQSPYSPDPNLPCSYSWEMSSLPIPNGWDPNGGTLYRDWKLRQARLFGDVVPAVRCVHHGDGRTLNLSLGGQVY